MNIGSRFSQHSFAQIPNVNMARSRFDRSFGVKDTFDFDFLVPFFCDEILPGDTCNLNVQAFVRLATQVKPVLDNMYLDFFFFFVPNRLVWDNWEKFNGAQDDPGDSTDYLVPVVSLTGTQKFQVGDIYDKFGLPTGVQNLNVNALPLRAYALIYNDWFRDQNLVGSLAVPKGDGPDAVGQYDLMKSAKKHDYFTSAQPWPQKGDTPTLPLGTSAPVYGEPLTSIIDGHVWQGINPSNVRKTGDAWILSSGASIPNAIAGRAAGGLTDAGGLSYFSLGAKHDYDLLPDSKPPYADLAEGVGPTINQFRQAIMMQSLLELDARGGTRYVEILRAHFNVISPDARLQRPEYLGGGSTPIVVTPVAQTSATGVSGGSTPAGSLSGVATTLTRHGFSQSFTEHGYVIGLLNVRADLTYQQGIRRMWSRSTRYDFYFPAFAMLGEQAVLNKEIYAVGIGGQDNAVFGYQERWAEYRYSPSEITGLFRSTSAGTLDYWHLAQRFTALPTLNATFMQENVPISRVLAAGSAANGAQFLLDSVFEITAARPMPLYSVPGLIDHF